MVNQDVGMDECANFGNYKLILVGGVIFGDDERRTPFDFWPEITAVCSSLLGDSRSIPACSWLSTCDRQSVILITVCFNLKPISLREKWYSVNANAIFN